MKLRRLELRRFGRFTDAVLDLAGITDDASGLHVVFGPNEAGKSTTLDAIRYTLYGMPAGSSKDAAYAFVHATKDIRTAVSLQLDDGGTLEFARNRGRDVSVLDFVTDAPDQALADRLAGVLSGVPKDLWVTRHGLSQQTLREGAAALLDGGGSSEALFAAATGMVGAYRVLDDIRAQRQEYLKDSGRGGRISDAISDLKAAATDFQRARRETGDFDDLATELDVVVRDTAAARAAHAGAVSRASVLTRVNEARGLLVQREELLAQRDAVPHELDHWDSATYERFAAARIVLDRTTGPIATREQQLADLRTQLDTLDVDPGVLAVADVVDSLHQRIAVVAAARERLATAARATDVFDEAVLAAYERTIAHLEAAITSARAVDQTAIDRDIARMSRERSELDAQAARIDPSIVDVDAASRVALPHVATRDALAAELAGSLVDQADMVRRVDDAAEELDRSRDALDALHARGGDVPDRAALDELRAERDAQWRRLRTDLGASRDALVPIAESITDAAARTDQYADRLLDASEQVSAVASAAAAADRAQARLESLEVHGAELLARHTEIAERWAAIWEPSGWAVADPASMLARTVALDVVLERRDQLDARAVELDARSTQLERSRSTLAQLVDADSGWSLDAVLELAAQRLTQARAGAQAQTELRASHVAVQEATAVVDDFARDVRDVIDRVPAAHAALIDATDPVLATTALRDLVRAATSNARAAEQLEARIRESLHELEELRGEHAGSAAVIDELVRDAGCSALSELLRRAVTWQQRAALDIRIGELDQAVLSQAKMTSAELAAERGGASEEQLAELLATALAEASAAADDLARLDAQRSDLDQRIGAIRSDGAQAAARIRLQDARAELDRLIPVYRQLVLQERLLQTMLEETAQQQRGPLVARTSEYVSRLTNGAWTQLLTGIDDAGASQAQLERADGSSVAITDLSEGTRDQLYLALRLAVLVDGAARGERMPLVVDDILMTFDDVRAAAALQLLADVSSEFQVIFLTHHEHLVEIATTALNPDVLRVHRLDQLSTAPALAI